ncbi:hypothetical protein CPB86DRAFT_336851, partial [Serendipita vermifera]
MPIATIKSLPFETHRNILLYLRPSDDLKRNPIRDLGRLMLVCKTWADIILRTPLFWRAIHFTFKWVWPARSFTKESLKEFVDYGQKFFRRAGDELLSIRMKVPLESHGSLNHLLQFLGRYAKVSQWRRLHLVDEECHKRQCAVKSDLSRLIELGGFPKLEWLSTDTVLHEPLLQWIDCTSVRLHTLSIEGSPYPFEDIRRILPNTLNRVSTLVLLYIDFDSLEEDFELSPNVTTLKIDSIPCDLNTVQLKHLSIQHGDLGFADQLEDMYPNLETLSVQDHLEYDSNILLPSVKHLDICIGASGIQFLQLPSLVTLQIRRSPGLDLEVWPDYLVSLPWWSVFTPKILFLDISLRPIAEYKQLMNQHPQLEELQIQFAEDFPTGQCLCNVFANHTHNGEAIPGNSQSTPLLQRLTVDFLYPQRNSDLQRKCAQNIIQERASTSM